LSLVLSALLKQQVNVRTRELQQENTERQAAQQRFMDIIEFLPDATFVIDQDKRIVAWNQACEFLTGVDKEALIGQGNYAYAEPFFGKRRPILIDLLDQPAAEVEATYAYVQREDSRMYAESFAPHLRGGQGAYLWGVASPLYDQDGKRCGAIETVRDVTEQRRIEEALRASEREYRELVMLANSIILRWTPDGRVTFLNEFGQRFFGYSATEILGRHMIGTIIPEQERQGRDLRPLIEEISANPQKFERNINENMRRNGERIWIDWTNKAVLDQQGEIKEILSIGSDITERKQAEEEVRRLNEDLRRHAQTLEQRVAERTADLAAINEEQRTIFESASTGIVLLRDRVIVRCNRKLEEISGFGPGELIGQSTRIWYPNEEAYRTGGEQVYAQIVKGETYRQEQQMARKDGTLFWVRLSLRALDRKNPLKGTVGIVEEITEEREAAEKLRKALKAAQAADRIKSAFLATMSHELRTPLNSIIGFTGIMLQGLTGPLNPEQHKQMTMVQTSSRHLLALINDVLDISRIEAGQFDLAVTSFELRSSLEKMVKLISPLAEQKGLKLEVDISEDTGMIVTDQRRLEQVILNLLNNAVKFTEQGQVRVACRIEKDQYLLSFADTGIGMQSEELAKIFQPFHQIDSGLTRKHEGTGLGLSICKKILDLMGCSIEVESQWGKGSTFLVRLPRQSGDTV
jgi:PAS domain S-box-containing protein